MDTGWNVCSKGVVVSFSPNLAAGVVLGLIGFLTIVTVYTLSSASIVMALGCLGRVYWHLEI